MTESAPNARTIALPELGEGLLDATVVAVLVGPGDEISRLQSVLEVETDKATVEVTSPWSGRVDSVLVEPGSLVQVGDDLLIVNAAGS
jgi:2-oxoisovalerate dehydrogenase E2 component (dihydrolipoyl transacylase)